METGFRFHKYSPYPVRRRWFSTWKICMFDYKRKRLLRRFNMIQSTKKITCCVPFSWHVVQTFRTVYLFLNCCFFNKSLFQPNFDIRQHVRDLSDSPPSLFFLPLSIVSVLCTFSVILHYALFYWKKNQFFQCMVFIFIDLTHFSVSH